MTNIININTHADYFKKRTISKGNRPHITDVISDILDMLNASTAPYSVYDTDYVLTPAQMIQVEQGKQALSLLLDD